MIQTVIVKALAAHTLQQHPTDSDEDVLSRIMHSAEVQITRRHLQNQGYIDEWLVSIKISNLSFVLATHQYKSNTWARDLGHLVRELEDGIRDVVAGG